MLDFSARGWARVVFGSALSTVFCVIAALFADSFNFAVMSDAARLRSIATDISVPILLAGPLTFFFMAKLRELAAANENLNTTLGAMAEGICCYDAKFRLTIWNGRYVEMFGMDPNSVRSGMTFGEVLELQRQRGNFEGSAELLQASIIGQVRAGQPFENATRLASGKTILSMHMPAPDGGWVATHEDVTERNAQKALIEERNTRFAAVLGNIRQGICMFDSSGHLATCNSQFTQLYKLPPELSVAGVPGERIDRHLREVGLVSPGEHSHSLLHLKEKAADVEATLVLLDGRSIRIVGSPMPDGGWVSTHEDVTERRRVEAQIEHDALHDALTGLPNRRFLEKELAKRSSLASLGIEGLGLLHIDLDRFKQINDTLGHGAGDAMLVHAAASLQASVGKNDFVARVGGDEFIVVSGFSGSPGHLASLAKRIASRMRIPVRHDGRDYRLSISVGIAHDGGHGIDTDRLLVSADLALYGAKTRGRGRAEFYEDSMRLQLAQTKEITDQIILAAERGEFIAHYQAKVDARTHRLSSIEALVRWQHPTRGILPPSEFLAIAEELDLAATIDQMVLFQTTDLLAHWRTLGIEAPPASVNVSARRLRDPGLVSRIERLAIPPGSISFELLESIHLDDIDEVAAWNIDQMKELGISIEIDDFGTGRASMLALSKLKPAKLKIDRQFVSAIVEAEEQRQLVRWMIEIGHSLGVKVVAEGVESLAQADILAGLGCDELQGYAFGRPVSAEEMTQVLLLETEYARRTVGTANRR